VTRAEQIAANLGAVHARIEAAARAAGRASGSVRLLAVSKKMPADDVRAALAGGQRAFGENYAQELRDKSALLAADATPPEWHFIGPLQSNKVKYVAGKVALVHSVDSVALLDAIEARGLPQSCLIQVNVAGEEGKGGVDPAALGAAIDACPVRVVGLSTMPPFSDDPEASRPYFARLAELAGEHGLSRLSMGTTQDWRVAVDEGATTIRIGSILFG